MSAEKTPRALRYNIAIVGKRNAGKSSLINAICGQDVAIVSAIAGTTTDAVAKPYELLPLGPVTFYDTAGLDDDSELGKQRIAATKKALFRADAAVLVVDEKGLDKHDFEIVSSLQGMNIPFIVVFNKCDINEPTTVDTLFCKKNKIPYTSVSTEKNIGISDIKTELIKLIPEEKQKQSLLLDGMVKEGDCVVLVTPIDSSAPKGRLILPQVQMLRELMDLHAYAIVTQPEELAKTLENIKIKPKLVITDSQAFAKVAEIVPQNVPLTSFSILFARLKGDFDVLLQGAKKIDELADNAKVLIAEACSHHAQDDDIAKVKIPALMKKYTKKNINFSFCVGSNFPENLEEFDLVIHCGACMLNQVEMQRRLRECLRRNVPITNYGMTISKTLGILERAVAPIIKK